MIRACCYTSASNEVEAFTTITKALSDEARLRALMMLTQGELCLCQVIEVLELAPSTVSKHMSLLHQARLVERRKRGRWHYYRLAGSDAPALVVEALAWVRRHLAQDPRIEQDRQAVERVRETDLKELSACYRG